MGDSNRSHRSARLWEPNEWLTRVMAHITEKRSPVGIVCDRDHGVNYIAAEFATGARAHSVVWADFDEHDALDPVSQGNKISDALYRALSARVVGHGLPVEQCLRVISRVVTSFHPITFVLTNVQFARETCQSLWSVAGSGVNLYVFGAKLSDVTLCQPESVVESETLLLRPEELAACLKSSHAMDEETLKRCADEAGYRYLRFVSRCISELQLPPVIVPEPMGATLVGEGSALISEQELVRAFAARGLHGDAIELAIRSGLVLDDTLVDMGAAHLMERGLSRRLFALLSRVGPAKRRLSDVTMKWYFVSATAVNRHSEVRPEVALYLQEHDAPELRALFAAAFPGPELVLETGAALRMVETPLTLRLHAFALSQTSSDQAGADLLSKAMRKAEALGQRDQVMACATDLADFWIKRGSYREALEWSRWALSYHLEHELKDEIRRLLALGLGAFARILTGDVIGLADAIEELDLAAKGIPTMEALVSTRADWHFLEGELTEACELYQMNLESAGFGQHHHAAVDLVHALVHRGKLEEARAVASRALVVARGMDAAAEGVANLAAGLAWLNSDVGRAKIHLEHAQSFLCEGIEAHKLAQASIALAIASLRLGDLDGVARALARGEVGIRELAPTGWRLLGGFHREVGSVRRIFVGEETHLELNFLGGDSVLLNGERLDLGLRHCEILAVLAMHPGGLTAEELGERVYGDRLNVSSLKAAVSRLRKRIPIASKPYSIGMPVRADFIAVEEHVTSGQLREALALYSGSLLPNAVAPEVVEAREHLEELLRRCVLAKGDADTALHLARVIGSDMELVESAMSRLPKHDVRNAVAAAMKRRIERAWLADG